MFRGSVFYVASCIGFFRIIMYCLQFWACYLLIKKKNCQIVATTQIYCIFVYYYRNFIIAGQFACSVCNIFLKIKP